MESNSEEHPSSSRTRVSPPRAPLAFRVGVVGHRPDRLGQADLGMLGNVIRTVLETVKTEVVSVAKDCARYYDTSAPALRAITPLAEGCDRVFAEQAIAVGYEIGCVMPFPQAEYERDFVGERAMEPASLERFRAILDRARNETALTCFELDGCREDASAAYGAAGRVVLNQSDLLVVVWDGFRLDKRGGTEETFDEARRRGLTVVWIDAHAPYHWQLLDAATPLPSAPKNTRVAPAGPANYENLRTWVRNTLDVPYEMKVGERREDPRANLERFYRERKPPWSIAIVWDLIRDLVGEGILRLPHIRVQDFEKAVEAEWPKGDASVFGRVDDFLCPFYAWPDKLAILYSNRYRSAFILAFSLAAAAVGLALLPVGFDFRPHTWGEYFCIGAEMSAILIILGLVLAGRLGRWHERWIDYRIAAELVRHARLLAPMAGGRPFPQVPAHWTTYGQPAATWMAWYVLAVERQFGLPGAVVNTDYIDRFLDRLTDRVSEQVRYHAKTQGRYHAIESALHRCGIVSLCLTVVACALHLLPVIWLASHLPAWISPHVLTFLCGFCPALGAAAQGIVNQGEFRRVARHSESMGIHLRRILIDVESLRGIIRESDASQQHYTRVCELASEAARLLVTEVLDWRVVFLDQPLKPPA